ncbi:MAG: flagellar hook protein FlgE [Alphaproteobacteria bacterium]
MSINSALLAGVSGLVANSSALAAISDNISNVNSIAYKRNEISFSNVVTSQSVEGRYSAGGVQGITRQFVSQQGLLQASSSSTDLAISGDGFFVVTNKGEGLTAADARAFTRSGSFMVDRDGFLVNKSNFYLQGWPVQPDGSFDVSGADLAKMSSINVKNLGSSVEPTSSIGISANLNKQGVVSAGEATYNNNTVASMTDYATDPLTGTKPDFVIEANVIDSTGGSRKVAIALLKDDSANPNTWHAEMYTIPTTLVTTGGRPGQLARGALQFSQNGSVDLANSTVFGAPGAPAELVLAASGTATTPRWANSLGIAAQTLELDLSKVTQYSAASTVNAVTSNGAGVGNVVSIQVDKEGIISAIYDNSQTYRIAKVGLATFPNADGLQAISGNAYRASAPAGQLTLKEAGVGGAGQIASSNLEASTVDLSAEFTALIQTQKAYSASSKIITTADQMLEELLNIKR